MRTKIRTAIEAAVQEVSGYESAAFRTGFASEMNKGGFELPCVWLCPLELKVRTGRTEGVNTYTGVMYFIEPIEGLTPEGKDEAWDRMEAAAIEVLNAIVPAGGIVATEGIRCVPDEYALTGFNTISVVVYFNVIAKYCASR